MYLFASNELSYLGFVSNEFGILGSSYLMGSFVTFPFGGGLGHTHSQCPQHYKTCRFLTGHFII